MEGNSGQPPPICSSALEPIDRLRILTEYGNSVDIDPKVPPRRYYRSGLQMVRMANSYFEEGSLENAYTLYMKFIVLFVEKIRLHPSFHSVSVTDRAINALKVREVMPRAEELKGRLLQKFSEEYEQYQKEMKEERATTHNICQEQPTAQPVYPECKNEPFWVPVKPAANTFINLNVTYPDAEAIDSNVNEQTVANRKLKPSDLELPAHSSVSRCSGSLGHRPDTAPGVDRSTKPRSLSPSMHSQLGLRRVIIPSQLMQKFLSLAQRNTEENIETCGILAGRLNSDQLVITHLLVPKQHGTSDSCTTQCEEEIFDIQDQNDLITFGWIHTHPSQTAFLSSVDLHTHYGYQHLMPEAIAIVCAPHHKETGIYMLTPNFGLDFIGNCQLQGFHPHPNDHDLFTTAHHAILDEKAQVDVMDMRLCQKS